METPELVEAKLKLTTNSLNVHQLSLVFEQVILLKRKEHEKSFSSLAEYKRHFEILLEYYKLYEHIKQLYLSIHQLDKVPAVPVSGIFMNDPHEMIFRVNFEAGVMEEKVQMYRDAIRLCDDNTEENQRSFVERYQMYITERMDLFFQLLIKYL